MRAIMVMFDSLNRDFLPNYGCDWTKLPNFERLGKCSTTFDNFYGGSMPCMPARRELHTGRYNFLHSFWSPMQPFDDSVIARMKAAKIYTHISTDHFHYWEDGGSGYLTKYDSHEIVRGQQGDPWKGQVAWPDFPDTLSRRKTGENWRHDWVNRSFIDAEDKMPQAKTFASGIDFVERSVNEDQWFLQIEAFDPHEPFYTQQSYKDLYPDDYHGKNLDWPDYCKNDYGDAATKHVRYEYAALMSMCDNYLGKLLDVMDANDMWKDTMLIVNTDHGFMLGEKEWMGKNLQPFYNELVNIPFFIHDPRAPHPGERRQALAQTVDIVPTMAEYFNIAPPDYMDGRSLSPIIASDSPIREGALFGVCGGHVNVTDGRYVYMHASANASNQPCNEYTLMPMHMNAPFSASELTNTTLTDEFAFTKGAKVMKIPAKMPFNAYWFGTRLYDLEADPKQMSPIIDHDVQRRLIILMRDMMKANDAPREQYERLGIPYDGDITQSMLDSYNTLQMPDLSGFNLKDETAQKAVAILLSTLPAPVAEAFKAALSAKKEVLRASDILAMAAQNAPAGMGARLVGMIKMYL